MKKSIVVTTILAICAMLLGGVTMMTSPAQAAEPRYGEGLLPDPTYIPTTPPKMGNVPASADLRQYAVPVGYQGYVNSCVGWAVGYDMMGWYAKSAGQNVQAFSPTYVYAQINDGKDKGSYVEDAMSLATKQGVDTQDDYLPQGNFNWRSQPTAAQNSNASKYRLTGFQTLFSVWRDRGTIDKRGYIESALSSGKPVVIGMMTPGSFTSWSQKNLNVAYTDTRPSDDRHAMLALAYDANGLIVQNSWGTGWGADGYIKLSWASVAALVEQADVATGYRPTANTPVVKVANSSAATLSSWNPTASQQSINVMVPSNTAWKVASAPSWVTVTPQTGFGLISSSETNTPVRLAVTANNTAAARTGVVTFTSTVGSPASTASVTVTQPTSAAVAAPTLSLAAATWAPVAGGASTSVAVTSNTTWSVSSNAAWVSASHTTGSGNGSVSLTAQANTATSARTATVTFTTTAGSPAQTRTVAVTQAGAAAAAPTLTLAASTWAPVAAGASTSVAVTSNTSWSVSSSAAWVSLSRTSGSGNVSVSLTAAANTSTSARTATVTFTTTSGSPAVTRTVSVSQAGVAAAAPTLTLSGSSWAPPAAGATTSVAVTSNTSWSVSSSAAWVSLSRTSGSGNVSVSLTAAANTSTSARTATVTFTTTSGSPQVSRTVSVSQSGQAAPAPTLTLSGSSWAPPAAGATTSVAVTSNTSWSVSSNAAWVSLSRTTGSGNVSVSLTAAANTSTSARTATVTFTTTSGSPQVSRTVSVSQSGHTAPAPTLTLSGTEWHPSAALTRASDPLTSNTSWSVSSNASWVSVSPASGTGNMSVVFTAQANTTYSIRSATVTFRTTSGSPQVTRTVTVTQAGLDCGSSLSSYCTWNISSPFSSTIDFNGDVDWFRFTAPTTGTYTFTSSRVSSNSLPDPYGAILQSNGRVLAWDNDSAGNKQFRIRVSLTAGQAYFLEVQGYNYRETGYYTVTAARVA
ncbi:MAG: hypothetical protein FWF43_01910 [Propionibacteriaceae bacterium]|nr:hypothetical protein [Propionibacteriaceae bacterium]